MTVLLIDRVMRTPFECNYYMGEHLMYHTDPFSLQTGLGASNYHSCTAWEAQVLHKFFKLLLGSAHFWGHKVNSKSCACSLRLKVLRDLNEVSFKEKVRELNHVCVAMDTTVCLIVPVDQGGSWIKVLGGSLGKFVSSTCFRISCLNDIHSFIRKMPIQF